MMVPTPPARHRPRRSYFAVKRTIDFTISFVMLALALPLLAVAAIAIKLDSRGPVFFSQERTGQHGNRIRIRKLRTMVADAEAQKASLAVVNERTGPDFKVADDPRITRVGRFLRLSSIDEIPQLWNVLTGSMSLVGPRPTSFSADTYSLWHTARLDAKPGLTGWWQVYGRSTENFDDRVRLELQYMNQRNTRRDLQLLLATVPAVLRGAGQ